MVRPERRAERGRHHERRLVPHRRRRRLLHGQRSARLDDHLHRVAGRRHQPLRPEDRPVEVDPPARRHLPHRRHHPRRSPTRKVAAPARRLQRGRRPPAAEAAVAAAAPVPATSSLPRLREPTTASTGARRSCSRTTTRARCTSAAIACSSRTHPRRHMDGVAGPDQEHRQKRSSDHGRRRHGADGVEARRRGFLQQHHHDRRIAARALASSGWAPTTATSR